jgi:hypothetical protein
MSRHTRATTVVSQARRFSTALTSVRPSRIQLSWTASSAQVLVATDAAGEGINLSVRT